MKRNSSIKTVIRMKDEKRESNIISVKEIPAPSDNDQLDRYTDSLCGDALSGNMP